MTKLDLGTGWTVERLSAPNRLATGPQGQMADVVDNIIAVRRA